MRSSRGPAVHTPPRVRLPVFAPPPTLPPAAAPPPPLRSAMSLGKTAAEREAEDTTRESDGGKLAALGLGALFHSNSAAGHAGHAPVGHAHSHGDVPCSHSHGSGHGDTVGGHGHGHGSTPTNLELADRALSSTIFDAAYTGNLIRLRELARLLEVQQLTEHPELLSHAQMQEQMQENASTAMADSAVEATVPAARKFGDEELALVFGSGHVTPRWMIQHDAKGMSVLHHAALGGHLDVLQWLGQQPAVNWEIKTRDAMEAHPVHLVRCSPFQISRLQSPDLKICWCLADSDTWALPCAMLYYH
eukprot:SAG31_NODE_1571_length_7851_cov_8.714525_10_plen_304_part_00